MPWPTSSACSSPATLAQLESASDEPWATLYGEHRRALLDLMAEIEQVTAENRRLLTAGARAVRETLLSVTETVRTYDNRGSASAATTGPRFMDEQA